MTVYRFVHLSDIHFGQERHDSAYLHDDVRASLLEDAAHLAQERGPANGILVTGDIAFAGKREEYTLASNWFESLTAAIGSSKLAVFPVPGNHDVDRARISPLARTMHSSLRAADVNTSLKELEDVMRHEQSAVMFLDKLGAYAEFAESYGRGFDDITRPKWQVELPFPSGHKLRLIGLTSVQVCDGDRRDAEGQMILGSNQFTLPRPPRDVVQVVMAHYPLRWYKDRQLIEAQFRERCRVLITGHEHEGEIQTISTEAGSQFLNINSGATNPPGQGSSVHYTYNWLEFDLRHESMSVELAVTVYPRVWSPSSPSFQPHYQRFQGQISKVFQVRCPEFTARSATPLSVTLAPPAASTPATAATPPATTTDTGNMAPEASGVVSIPLTPTATPPFISTQSATATGATVTADVTTDTRRASSGRSSEERATMGGEHDAHFARLRYFFWKYLDYGQRITVLAQLGLIPSLPTRPLPQTLERQALDKAASQGRLADVWRVVMERLPADKREPNPFNS